MGTMYLKLTSAILSVLCINGVYASWKKGVAANPLNLLCDDFKVLNNMTWWYSWHIDMTYYDQKVNHGHGCPAGTKSTLPHYMPMVKTFNQHTDLSVLDPHAPFILGFNEPNHKDEAHGGLTPQHAADAWRQIEQHSHGIRLVSPAMAGEDYKWLDEFFRLCDGCRIDYIAAHKYSCDANEIMGFMNRLWHRYHKKIWLTEFACPLSTSEDQQLHLMQKLLPQLEAAPFISRYAWFSARRLRDDARTNHQASLLHANSSTLTKIGQFYNNFQKHAAHPIVG